MRIRFSPSGPLPGFVIEADDESDSGILEMIGNLQTEGYNMSIGATTLASGAKLRYPSICLSMVKVR